MKISERKSDLFNFSFSERDHASEALNIGKLINNSKCYFEETKRFMKKEKNGILKTTEKESTIMSKPIKLNKNNKIDSIKPAIFVLNFKEKKDLNLEKEFKNINHNFLQILDLSQMNLQDFPKEIFIFINLKVLFLDKNWIQFIPLDSSKKLQNLEKFSISRNILHFLPENMENWFQNLTYFDISENFIEEIDYSFGKFKNLEVLKIEKNSFSSFTTEISNLNNLKEFYIDWFEFTNPKIEEKNTSIIEKLINLCTIFKKENKKMITFFDFIEFFSKEKCDFTKINENNQCLIHLASYGENIGVIRSLNEYDLNLKNYLDNKNETPLLFSIKERKFRSARTLIQLGANPNLGNNNCFGN